MSSLILIFLLFLLQFIYIPIGTSFFEGSKVYLAEAGIFSLLLIKLFSSDGFSIKKIPKKVLIFVGILFLITFYHLVFHQTRTVLFGNRFRMQGTFLIWLLVLFSILSAKIKIDKWVTPYFITGILVIQLICTLLFVGIGADRPVGTIGEPNALAAAMIFLWPFLIFNQNKTVKNKIITAIGLLCAVLIIFVTGSRSGFIALGVQTIYLVIHRFFPKKQLLAVLLAFSMLLLSMFLPFITHRNEYEDRGEIWTAAVVAAAHHPLLGIGFGNMEYELHKANLQLHNHLPGYYVDSAHNIFLDWLIATGIAGLSIFIFFLANTFRTFMKKNQIQNIVLFLGLLAALSFNPASIVSLIGLWWLIGQSST